MDILLLWLMIANITLLSMHETDAAYWKEWRLFGSWGSSLADRTGLTIFVLARIPIYLLLLSGLVFLNSAYGRSVSIFFSGFLIFHFIIHMIYKRKGSEEFDWPISYITQFAMLAVSLVQLTVTFFLV